MRVRDGVKLRVRVMVRVTIRVMARLRLGLGWAITPSKGAPASRYRGDTGEI
jgi:hypothetical protein